MKNKIKGFILGIIVTLLMNSIVYASGGNTNLIEVIFNNVNIALNGEEMAKCGDSYTLNDGEEVPYSILYKGTTYLPLRKVAEMLDKNVGWDGETHTANINDKDFLDLEIINDEELNKFADFAIKKDNKYYNIFNFECNNMLINGKGKLYTQEGFHFNLYSLIYLLAGTYNIEESNNPNLDGSIILPYSYGTVENGEVQLNNWEEYEGINTISVYEITCYNRDKSKNYTIKFSDGKIIPTSKDGVDNLVLINGEEYINISGILIYLDYNFRIYIDEKKGCNIIEILE